MMKPDAYRHIDLRYIYDMADGESDFVVEMISTYLASIPVTIALLEEAAVKGDFTSITFCAHKLKGSFNFIGCKQLDGLFISMEENSRAAKNIDQIRDGLVQVLTLSAEVTAELEALQAAAGKEDI